MLKILLIILFIVVIIITIYLIYSLKKVEKYRIEQITGHFGGIPNKSQIWPQCGGVELGPDYDDPRVRYYNRL